MKFLLTSELGRLAKWLRILGFDAEYTREKNTGSVIIRALRDGRIILTRNHHFPKRTGIRILTLRSQALKSELAETIKELKLAVNDDMMFSRCTICNKELVNIERSRVAGRVPEYIYEANEKFLTCPKCSRVYWQGSHWGNVSSTLKEIWSL